MKRLLLCLAPWMAVAGMAQSVALRPASIQLTHYASAPGWREGDSCWIAPAEVEKWGWTYRMVGNDVTLSAEGRTVKVAARNLDGKLLLPVHEIAHQLGAISNWQPDRDIYLALGEARKIQVKNGKVSIDGTVSFRPEVTFMENPGRIVIDLKGLRMPSGSRLDLDGSARAGQHSPDTVRLIVVANDKPDGGRFAPGRTFNFSFQPTPEKPNPNPQPEGQVTTPPVQPPVQQDPNLQPGIVAWTQAGPMSVIKETEKRAELSIALPTPLQGAPQLKRPNPKTIILVLPKAHYVPPEAPLGSPSIVAVEPEEVGDKLNLTIRLARPMGVEFTASATALTMVLSKPEIGDGKLAGKVVVIDPGHGGHDGGAQDAGKSVKEKDLALSISKLVAENLAKEGATVIMTRKTDVFISLTERPQIANRNGADFFVSIHINSNKKADSTSGFISFYHGGKPMGQLLAECMQGEIKKVAKLPSMGVWSDRRIYDSGFAVLRGATMPAVLLELGFINHKTDRARLQEQEYQISTAKAIVRGIKVYLGDANP